MKDEQVTGFLKPLPLLIMQLQILWMRWLRLESKIARQ